MNHNGVTPLLIAVDIRNDSFAYHLLAKWNTIVVDKQKNLDTPLMVAAWNGDTIMVPKQSNCCPSRYRR